MSADFHSFGFSHLNSGVGVFLFLILFPANNYNYRYKNKWKSRWKSRWKSKWKSKWKSRWKLKWKYILRVLLFPNSSVVLGQVPRNITYNNNNIYDNNNLMLMMKIFDFTVNDVDDGDGHYDRYCDQVDYQDHTIIIDDEFDTTCTMIFDTTSTTTAKFDTHTIDVESHTTSATIYDITTTVVDDIKCTTDRSTIEDDVDVDNHFDRDNNQDHTIIIDDEFDTTIIDNEFYTTSITNDEFTTTTTTGEAKEETVYGTTIITCITTTVDDTSIDNELDTTCTTTTCTTIDDEFTTSTSTEEDESTATSDTVIEFGTTITTCATIYDTTIDVEFTTSTTTTIIESHNTSTTTAKFDTHTIDIESHTTSATIYDITTTVVDDIKCTTDRSTIADDVDIDNHCDRDNNQDHTIIIDNEFDTTIIDDESCTTTDFGTRCDHYNGNMVPNIRNCAYYDDFDSHCDCYYRNSDRDYDRGHTIKHLNYDLSTMISNSRNGVRNVDFDTHYSVSDKPSYDSSNDVREINTVSNTDHDIDNNVRPDSLYNADNNGRSDLLYHVNTIQQDDFVCDNNQYYLNNNNCDPVSNNDNANSIQDIVDTIIDVKMNGMFYIPAKKKYIFYFLIPKKKRSFHTPKKIPYMIQEYSKHRNIPYIVQNIPYIVLDTTQISLNEASCTVLQYYISLYEEPCTVQYSKSQSGVRYNDFDTAIFSVYTAFVSVVPPNGVDIVSDATNSNDTNDNADDTVNSVITTTDNVRDIDPDSVNNDRDCDRDNNKDHPINDFDTNYSRNYDRNIDFDIHYDQYMVTNIRSMVQINVFGAHNGQNMVPNSRYRSRNDYFDAHYDRNMVPINDSDPQYDQNCGRNDENSLAIKHLNYAVDDVYNISSPDLPNNVRTNLLYSHFDCSDGSGIVRDDEFFNHFSATNANTIADTIVDTIVDSTDLASSSNNFNSRIDETSSPSLSSPSKSRSRRQIKNPLTLIILSYYNVKNNYQSMVVTDSDVDPDTVTEFTSVHHGCALYLYLVPILYYDVQYLMVCYSTNTTIGDDGNRIDSNCDHDLVHYGVVYTYVHVYYVVQLPLYNIKRSYGCNNSNTTSNNGCNNSNTTSNNINNTNCDNNNLCHTVGLLSLPPFLPIVMEKKKKIDNTSKIDVDANNKTSLVTTMTSQSSRSMIMIIIMVKNNQFQAYDMLVDAIHRTADDVDYESFYITLKSTYHDRDDARELAFDDVIIDHHANDSDYDLHFIHDTVHKNNNLVVTDDDDHNDVIVSHRASDSDRLEYALYFAYDEVRATMEEETIYGTTSTTCTTIADTFTTSTTEEEDRSIIEYHTTCATTLCDTTTSDTVIESGTTTADDASDSITTTVDSVLVRVLGCGMSRVKDNIKAYYVICGMARLGYVPSVLLAHRFSVIDPAFDITIVYSRSVSHLMKLSNKNHLYDIQKKNPYSLCPFYSSIPSVTMVENNQVQVCDGALRMLVDGTHNTAGDVDYESVYLALKSNYHDRDDACELAFDTKHTTARDNNQRTTYKVHQSLYYGVDTYGDHDHMLLRCKDNKCKNLIPPLWKQAVHFDTSSPLYFVYSSIPGLYSSIVASNIISPSSLWHKQVHQSDNIVLPLFLPQKRVQVQVQVNNNNGHDIICDDANGISNSFGDIAHPRSVFDLCGTKSRFYDVQYSIYTAFVSVIPHNMVDIDCNPVHYGVVYAYVYAHNDGFFNEKGFTLYYDNNFTCKNSPQNVNVDSTVRIPDDGAVNYVVNDIIRSNNSDMNTNNDDKVKINTNCCYDDTNKILSFYLWWQQVQVRVSDYDNNDVIVDGPAIDNDHDLYAIHDIVRNYLWWQQVRVRVLGDDHNDITVDHYACDNDYDIHVIYYTARNNNGSVFTDDDDHHNNNINIITGDYDIYDEDNNNNVNRYDVGIAQDNDLVANDREENDYSTCLVQCVLSSSGTTSIADDCDPVSANDNYMTRYDNARPTISSMSSLTSLTILLNLPSLETSSSSNRDTCVGSNPHHGDDTDPAHLSPTASIYILCVLSSLKPTTLWSNLFHQSSDCDLVCLGYVLAALVASLATISFISSYLPSSTFSSLSVIDYRFVSYWLPSNAYVPDTIGSSFNPSDVSSFVNLQQLHLMLSLERTYFLGGFASNTTFLYPLTFKIYCDFNPISLVLMIILMIMGLCCFWILPQITSHESGLNPVTSPVTSPTISISS